MALKFTVRINRIKRPSVQIMRLSEDNKVTSMGRLPDLTPDTIKAFSEKEALSEYDIFTLENAVGQLVTNQEDLNNPDLIDFHREIVYFPKNYEEACFKLWKLAKENNIPFCPGEIMQKALLLKAKALERKLNEIKKEPVKILESLGISIDKPENEIDRQKERITCRKLFRFLLNTKINKENIARDFNDIAKNYDKKDVMKPHYLEDLATNIRKLPLWYNTVAIDLLLHYNKNPLDKLSIEAVCENWLRLRKETMNEPEAFEAFQTTFKTTPSEEPIVKSAIKKEYAKGLPI